MASQLYAVLPLTEHPPYPRPCPACDGRGVTGDRYEMPTDGRPSQNALTASPAYRAALRDALDYARQASRNPEPRP
jgi:hypothetical protein